jgi:hypothetical protein
LEYFPSSRRESECKRKTSHLQMDMGLADQLSFPVLKRAKATSIV